MDLLKTINEFLNSLNFTFFFLHIYPQNIKFKQMKDIIKMNKLAGTITESQAKRMMDVLDENMGLSDEKKLNEGDYEKSADKIQSRLKMLAGYHLADIKNTLNSLGAEKFKQELDALKAYVDEYFNTKPQ